MSRQFLGCSFLLALFSTGCNPARTNAAQDAPDLILIRGRITTQTSTAPEAEALAIKSGRITQVGRSADLGRLAGPETRVIDLKGRRVIPGLNDSHSHYIRGGLAFTLELRWDGVPTLAEGLAMIREQAARTPAGQWVRVIGGWTPHQFAEKRLPTPAELDEAAPNTPVYIQYFYSRAIVNRTGLRVLGIDRRTVAPPGTRIERGQAGEATGLLVADPHPGLLYKSIAALPAASAEVQVNSTLHLFRTLARFGLTSVIDAGGGGQRYPTDYEPALSLARGGRLPLRVAYNLFAQTPGQELKEIQSWTVSATPGQNADPARPNGFVLEGGGEYLVWSAGDFENFLSPRPDLAASMEAELRAAITHLVIKRWPFRIHATYDESISRILDVIEAVNAKHPLNGLRWSIEHAETVKARNIDRIKALGGGIALQDRMAFLGDDFLARYGPEAAAASPPLRLILDKAAPFGIGTDGTRGSSFNPWVTLSWLVTGRTVGGTTIYPPANRLTRVEALHAHTLGSAWFSGDEEVKGRLAPGQYADLAVLSHDYFTVPDEDIDNIESVLTIVNGAIVWGAGEFTDLAPAAPPVAPAWSPLTRFDAYRRGRQAGSAALAQDRTPDDPNLVWTASQVALTAQEVRPGIFAVFPDDAAVKNKAGVPVATSGGFIVGTESVLVIDTMINARLANQLIALIRSKTDKPIRFVVNTSYHGDHSYGNYVFGKDVEIIQHEETQKYIQAKFADDVAFMKKYFGANQGLDDVRPRRATSTVGNRETRRIDVGGKTVELLHLGFAQTTGDLFVWLPRERVLFTGNPVIAAPPSSIPWLLDGHVRDALTTLRALRKRLPKDAVVVPGHGAPTDARSIDAHIAYLDQLQREVSAAVARGLTLEETVKAVPMAQYSAYKVYPWVHFQVNIPQAYQEAKSRR